MHSMYYELEEMVEELLVDPMGTFTMAFSETNDHLLAMSCDESLVVDARDSGTCALLAFFRGKDLWVAAAGDCRGIIGRRVESGELEVVEMSRDHAVDVPEEKARLEANGGFVRMEGYDEDGEIIPSRLYTAEGSGTPGLRVSRVLGDLNVKHLVSCEPEVRHRQLSGEDEFLILASDGVWEFMPNEKVLQVVDKSWKAKGRAEDACKSICVQAVLQWRQHEGAYRDDISAFVVHLPTVAKELQRELERNAATADGA